jgi:endonuclease/exonuclease/phosphatase family metal-dependent hydrolase
MFGLDGRSLLKNVIGHWAVHFQSNEDRIWKRVDLSETVETIKSSKADIMGVCEILSGHQRKFRSRLKKIGYNHVWVIS